MIILAKAAFTSSISMFFNKINFFELVTPDTSFTSLIDFLKTPERYLRSCSLALPRRAYSVSLIWIDLRHLL